jgi:hypothetical protein
MTFSIVSFRAGPGIEIEKRVDSRFRGNDKMRQFVFGSGIRGEKLIERGEYET